MTTLPPIHWSSFLLGALAGMAALAVGPAGLYWIICTVIDHRRARRLASERP